METWVRKPPKRSGRTLSHPLALVPLRLLSWPQAGHDTEVCALLRGDEAGGTAAGGGGGRRRRLRGVRRHVRDAAAAVLAHPPGKH